MVKLLFVGIFLFLTGCATTNDNPTPKAPVEDGSNKAASAQDSKADNDASSRGLNTDSKYSIEALNDADSPLSVRTIYFAFDSAELTPESSDSLIEHARFLTLNTGIKIVLEGHTDERGTRDYNLALGEGRAKSVHEFLTSQGVNSNQLEVISFGEEQAVATEHNETAWQLNRRVELIYTH